MSNPMKSAAARGRSFVVGTAFCCAFFLSACTAPKTAQPVPANTEISQTSAMQAASIPIPAPQPAKPESLRLVLRSAAEITAAKQSSATILAQPLVGDLWQALAIETDSNDSVAYRFATSSDLDQLRLTPDGAFALGQQNAAAALAPLVSVTHDLTSHQIGVIQSKGDETSRVLDAKHWAPLAQQLDGHLLIAVPASDTVLYCEENGSQSVRTFAATARDAAAKAQHAVSPVLLRWTPTGWQSVAVP
jgi:hypothetical protein